MRSIIRHIRYPLLSLFLVFGLIAAEACADVSDTVSRTFQVQPGGTLTLESDLGSVKVQTSSQNVVEVNVDRRANVIGNIRGKEILERFQVEFDQKGNDVEVTGEMEDRRRSRLQVHYRITIPEKYNVDLSTAGGSIDVADLDGSVISRTAGGSIQIGKVRGPVSAKTAGGSIRLGGSSGNVELKTAGGSIIVGRVLSDVKVETSGGSIHLGEVNGTLEARTAGGSITIAGVTDAVDARTSGGSVEATLLSQPKGDCRLATSAGSVTVNVPENIQLDIEARSMGGKIITDLPITVRGELSQGRIEGTLNGGGPLLELKTSAGNISISRGKKVL